jgi:hypothetical protein
MWCFDDMTNFNELPHWYQVEKQDAILSSEESGF